MPTASQIAAARGVTDTGDICQDDWTPLCSSGVYAGQYVHVGASFSLRVRYSPDPFFHQREARGAFLFARRAPADSGVHAQV